MTADERLTRIERRVADLRSDDDTVDQADVEALLDSAESVDRRAGLRALALSATGSYGCFEDDLPSLAPYLNDDDPDVRYNALQAAIELLSARSEPVADTPVIVDRLDDESDRVAETALDAVTAVAKRDPVAVEAATPRVVEFLDADRSAVRRQAIRYLLVVAQDRPTEIVLALDRLVALLGETHEMPEFEGENWTSLLSDTGFRQDFVSHSHEERERHMTLREFAAELLVILTRERPYAVQSYIDELFEHLTGSESETSPDPHVREHTLRVLTALGDHCPATVVDAVDKLVACLDPDHPESLNGAAIKPLGIAATEQPDRVVPILLDYVSLLVELLDHRDPHVRGTAVGILGRIADHDRAAVETVQRSIVELLEDQHDFVRGNAVWTLAAVGSDRAVSALREHRDIESDGTVRDSIDRVLAASDGTTKADQGT